MSVGSNVAVLVGEGVLVVSDVGEAVIVGAGSVAVGCLFRNADATKLDLITLIEVCGSSRRMMIAVYLYQGPRRLRATGFGVEMELVGADVVTSVAIAVYFTQRCVGRSRKTGQPLKTSFSAVSTPNFAVRAC